MTDAKKEYKYDVFISHSTKDKIKVEKICEILEKSGLRCFYAPRDIPVGSNWAAEIVNGINKSNIFLLVFGENSINAEYVQQELALAVSEGHHIIPFRIDNTKTNDGAVAFHLAGKRNVKWVDGTIEPFVDRVNVLARKISDIIRPHSSIKKILIGGAIILCILIVSIVGISIACADSDPYNQALADYNAGNYTAAFSAFKKLADEGNASAMYYLGHCYQYGEGTSIEYDKAFENYQKAADAGSANGMFMSGYCWYSKIGTDRNYEKAFEYFQKAAEAGSANGMEWLSYCYEKGVGRPPDLSKAIEWAKKGMEAGDDKAKERYERLTK